MAVIQTKVNTQTDSYKKNRKELLDLISKINELEKAA
jgi:hypothetical protein